MSTPAQRPLSPAERFFAAIARAVLARRWAALGFTTVVTVILAFGIPAIKVDNSNEVWFEEDDPTVERYEALKSTFGADTFIYFLLETGDVFTPETLAQLTAIERELGSMRYKDQPVFRELIHLGNVNHLQGSADHIDVVPITKDLPPGAAGMATWRQRTFELPTYEGLLVNREGTATGIVAMMTLHPGDGDYHSYLADALRTKLTTAPLQGMPLTAAGGPLLDADMDRVTSKEAVVFGLLALLANLIAMVALFRRWPGVVIPAAVVVTTLIWTFGLMGYLGASVNVVMVILPALLISVSISDSIHLLSEYQLQRAHGLDRHAAMVATLGKVGLAALLTSTTTMAGMVSLTLAPIPPIQTLGWASAMGVGLALVITLLLVPSLTSLTDLAPRKDTAGPARPAPIMAWLADIAVRHAKAIVGVSFVIIAVSTWGASKIQIETDFVRSFKERFPTRQAFQRIEDGLGATASLQLVIDSGKEGGVKDPEFLRKTTELQAWIAQSYPNVVKTLSLADLVKNLNKVVMDGERDAYAIPATSAAVAQELLLYENADPEGLFQVVTDDYRTTRIDVRAKNGGTHEASVMMEATLAQARAIYGPDVHVHFTGIQQLFVVMSENLADGQIKSYIAAFVMILLMMIAVLGSLRLGLWSMVPNLLPVLLTMAVMGWLGLPLDFVTLLVACVAIGIAVDDTIHFLIRFSKELVFRNGDYEGAVRHSLVTVGRAMTFTTLVLVAGFLMFTPSVSMSVALFGGLVAFTIAVAWVADVLLMPALLIVFRPLRTEPSVKAPKPVETPKLAEAQSA